MKPSPLPRLPNLAVALRQALRGYTDEDPNTSSERYRTAMAVLAELARIMPEPCPAEIAEALS